jgi:glycogen debranching enzyme
VTVTETATATATATATGTGTGTGPGPGPGAAPGRQFLPAGPVWPAPARLTGPPALVRLLERGQADLAALALTDPADPRDTFPAAGSPWYLTLFGRDSLWAARLTLPLGTGLAAGTLRALARRQGTRHAPDTAEAPGRIPHEVRAEATGDLPSVYFGTVDATSLWVCLLHDAWQWGMPAAEVAELLDPLQAALHWLREDADPDRDGFLEYVDRTGHGLANQGWKDSGDSIQFPDGTIATPPIALSEAQAYAYQAALGGAALLDAYGRPGADRMRDWARRLRGRFREAFWVRDARGRFPAIALDGAKRPVDVAASNLGHLLGTGLLDPAEAAVVAARLAGPDLDCGFGLRTLSAEAAAFNPLGYHTGSVWPHDTAIAVLGLVAEGHPAVAFSLADGLLRAAPRFDHQLPELFAASPAGEDAHPLAYPAACRPQAWSAAVPVALLAAALGLVPDAPNGRLAVRAAPEFSAWYPLRIEGLRLAGAPMTITVHSDGHVDVDPTAPVEVDAPSAGTR